MNSKTDNTVLTNGIIKNKKFFPKKNLPSGTIRIVLTTQCNYECRYCFAEGEINKNSRVLKLEDLKKVLMVAKEFGITNVKLTGGEPLLYPQLEELLSYIRTIEIPYIDLTTNVSCLSKEKIKMLNTYQVNALTLSVNTLNREKFIYLSKFQDYDLVRNNLNNVVKYFEGKLRINCIIFDYKYNKAEYDEIVNFCKENQLGLRLVEPSKVKNMEITYKKEKFYEYINILKKKADKIIVSDCKSVEYLFFDNWYITVMHSLCDNKLCESCKDYMYMRVNSSMSLKPCLSRIDTEVPIDVSSESKIRCAFIEAINWMGVGITNEDE